MTDRQRDRLADRHRHAEGRMVERYVGGKEGRKKYTRAL